MGPFALIAFSPASAEESFWLLDDSADNPKRLPANGKSPTASMPNGKLRYAA